MSIRLCIAALLLLASCADHPVPATSSVGPVSDPSICTPTSVSLPLLGTGGDSPILPVRVHGHDAAMFFSPGFVPLLFRDNPSFWFPRYHRINMREPDVDTGPAYTSVARGLSIGGLASTDRRGFVLPDSDDRMVDGRPIAGMLGRDILPDEALVDLDLPGRRLAVSAPRPGCPIVPHAALPGSIAMADDVLLVAARIDGQPVQAILDPDLAVSILPRDVANRIGIADAALANDPSVVTRFSRGVLGRRHRIATLQLGDVRLEHVAFDIEDGVRYPMLGLNVFDLGRGVFDFANARFLFVQTTTILPPTTGLHFNRTKVTHVTVDE